MQLFDTVVFGPSELDRAAHLRGQDLLARGSGSAQNSHAIALWHGKPLLGPGEMREAIRLPLEHPLFAECPAPIFLGLEGEEMCFAHDLSHWSPTQDQLGIPADFLDVTEQAHPLLAPDQRFCDLRANMTVLSPRDGELASMAKALFAWHQSHRFCAACGVQSEMVQSGWQRSCPACGTQHFPRTDPVVIMLITYGNSVLMGRSPGWPEGMYSLLAGFVEPGETPESAVRREVLEEAGIAVGPVHYLGSQPWAFPSSLMMGFHGVATSETIEVDPTEIEDAIWVTREDMMRSMAGELEGLKPARKGSIAEFIIRHWLADRLGI